VHPTDAQLAYPDGCPYEGQTGHPTTPFPHYNLFNTSAVMPARTDTDGALCLSGMLDLLVDQLGDALPMS
jgi:hypothetical protein